MSLSRNKAYRSRLRSSIGYTNFAVLILGFGLIVIGIAGYVIPDFGFGHGAAIVIAMIGAFVLFLGLVPPIIEVTNVSQTAGIFIAMLIVFVLMLIGLVLSGVLEVNI